MITVTVGTDTVTVPGIDPYGVTLPAGLGPVAVAEYHRRAELDVTENFGGPQNSGMLDPTAPLTVYPNLVTVQAGDVYVNADFRGGLLFAGKGTIVNFRVTSTRPDYTVRGTSHSNLAGLYGSLLIGGVVDAQATNEYQACMMGSCSTQLFCEYLNGVDGFDFTAANQTDPTLIVLPYIHDMRVLPAPNTHPNDKPVPLTHDDGMQGQCGGQITILGPYVANIPMQAILIKQEVSSDAAHHLAMTVDNLHVGPGCKTGVNISVALGNQLADTIIRNPVIEVGTPIGVIANLKPGDPNAFLGQIINPRWSDGTPVTITKGA